MHICEDVQAALHSEIEEAHGIIDSHDAQMTAAKSDYNRLGDKYDDEVSYQQHVKNGFYSSSKSKLIEFEVVLKVNEDSNRIKLESKNSDDSI